MRCLFYPFLDPFKLEHGYGSELDLQLGESLVLLRSLNSIEMNLDLEDFGRLEHGGECFWLLFVGIHGEK